jgi:precorrin-2 dehydrogenase/sirohydrochlorin ferrochelatase
LINAVDQPADCNFIVPSIVKRGDLSIAISTSGKSPALARKIRKELEEQFGNEYETFLILMGRLRERVLSKGLLQKENSRIFHEIVNSGVLNALARDDWEEVEAILKKILPKDVDTKGILDDFVKS